MVATAIAATAPIIPATMYIVGGGSSGLDGVEGFGEGDTVGEGDEFGDGAGDGADGGD
jgi:hypothetical protein